MSQPLALIVEDDDDVSDFYKMVLEFAHYQIEQVADGQAALDWLQGHVPALVVLDLLLPKVSGKQILAEMRRDARLQDVRVIVITGEGRAIEREVETMADFVLTKPISYDQLFRLAKKVSQAS